MAVVIISAILSIPQTAGGSNEYEVATAQCLAHTQSNCSGTITVGQNQYACVWNPSEGKCLVQQNSGASPICNPISPSGDQGYKILLPYNQAITITYQNFFSVPNNGTLNCGDDGDQAAPYTCSGSPNGTCNANCSYTNSPADLAQVQLSNGSQQANCAASQIRFQYCGDGTCQSTPLENCPADTAYCNALGQHQTCETGLHQWLRIHFHSVWLPGW